MQNERKGFTLIELLVVVSIIALLMGILMPSLQKARAQAKLTLCGNKQRGIVTAVNVYSSEYKSKLPGSVQGQCVPADRTKATFWTYPMRLKYYYGTAYGLNGGSVIDILGKYMAEPDYFACPTSFTNPDWQKDFFSSYKDTRVMMMDCSYFLLWNYGGFQSQEGKSFRTVNGGDTLMVTDIFLGGDQYNKGPGGENQLISTHPFKGAMLQKFKNQTDVINPNTREAMYAMFYMKPESSSVVPSVPMNACYLDGHVSRTTLADGYRKVNNAMTGKTTSIYLPTQWK